MLVLKCAGRLSVQVISGAKYSFCPETASRKLRECINTIFGYPKIKILFKQYLWVYSIHVFDQCNKHREYAERSGSSSRLELLRTEQRD